MSSPVPLQRWYPIRLNTFGGACSVQDVLRVLSHAGVQVRLVDSTAGDLAEVFCSAPEEAIQAETLLGQLLADQLLRQDILHKADGRITDLVDGLLARAAGA